MRMMRHIIFAMLLLTINSLALSAVNLDAARNNYRMHLLEQGAVVDNYGDLYSITIPAHLLFVEQSPRLLPAADSILGNLIKYLRSFMKINVEVYAETATDKKEHTYTRQKNLSRARSKIILEYLWQVGIDSRFMFTHNKAIKKYCDNDCNDNIEITFRQIIR
jgi:outer membrane protein OmpA-like peptidoglycan-associated protein